MMRQCIATVPRCCSLCWLELELPARNNSKLISMHQLTPTVIYGFSECSWAMKHENKATKHASNL